MHIKYNINGQEGEGRRVIQKDKYKDKHKNRQNIKLHYMFSYNKWRINIIGDSKLSKW